MGANDWSADATFKEGFADRTEYYNEKIKKAKSRIEARKAASQVAGYFDHFELPTFKLQRTFDETTHKASYEIVEGTRTVSVPEFTVSKRIARNGYYKAKNYVHSKISENEEDNTAIEAFHKIEQAGETGIVTIKNTLPSKKQIARKFSDEFRKSAQKAEKNLNYTLFQKEIEEKGVKFGSKAASEEAKKKALKEAKRKAFKERMKRLTRKEVAKRTAKEGGKAAAGAAGGTAAGATAGGTAAAVGAETVGVNAVGLATGVEEYILIAIAIIMIVIAAILTIIMVALMVFFFVFFQNEVLGSIWQSEPTEIEQAELHMTYLEANLKDYLNNVDEYEPDYDGYVIEWDSIGHNPFTLINYLSAEHGEFEYDDVEDEIDDLFNQMYTLSKSEKEVVIANPNKASPEDPDTVTFKILVVKLKSKSLDDIVEDLMDDEMKEMYDVYEETKGGLQFMDSPIGDTYIDKMSCVYGYRVHPISGEIKLHTGIDIAIPEGTPLYAPFDGTISKVGNEPSGYGNYVEITSEDGFTVKYAHMSTVQVVQGQSVLKSDTVGLSGNTGASTGPHVHVECIENGSYLNPIFYFYDE